MEAPVEARRGGSERVACSRHLQDTPQASNRGMGQCRPCTWDRVLRTALRGRRLAIDHKRWRWRWRWFGRPGRRRLRPGFRAALWKPQSVRTGVRTIRPRKPGTRGLGRSPLASPELAKALVRGHKGHQRALVASCGKAGDGHYGSEGWGFESLPARYVRADTAALCALVAGQDVAAGGDGAFRLVRGVARDRFISTVDPVTVTRAANRSFGPRRCWVHRLSVHVDVRLDRSVRLCPFPPAPQPVQCQSDVAYQQRRGGPGARVDAGLLCQIWITSRLRRPSAGVGNHRRPNEVVHDGARRGRVRGGRGRRGERARTSFSQPSCPHLCGCRPAEALRAAHATAWRMVGT
jgi:hypothetical protein